MTQTLSIARFSLVFVLATFIGSTASAAVVVEYDFSSGVQGFTGNNITGLTTSSGSITGVASNTDPQLILASGQLPGGLVPTVGRLGQPLNIVFEKPTAPVAGLCPLPTPATRLGLYSIQTWA